MTDYKKILEFTEKLPWCALVTTGRAGSDFFQSLLDGHPEVFVFNGHFKFHEYWKTSYCAKSPVPEASDIADEFIGCFIHHFRSKYDLVEGKNELGENQDQSVKIDTVVFKNHFVELMNVRKITTRNILESIYVAYALTLGEDIWQKRLFFHHHHHIWNLHNFIYDFPQSSVISMTRDPRALVVSGVEHWAKRLPASFHAGRYFFTLKRAIDDATGVQKLGVRYMVLRLEDLGDEKVILFACSWLGISWHECMKRSTWCGLRWWGDWLSDKKKILREELAFAPGLVTNRWEKKLGRIDKYLFGFLLNERLRYYGYPVQDYRSFIHYFIAAFLILLPTTYEKKFLSPRYLWNSLKGSRGDKKKFLMSFYFYIKRIALYYGLLYNKSRKRLFIPALISNKYDLSYLP